MTDAKIHVDLLDDDRRQRAIALMLAHELFGATDPGATRLKLARWIIDGDTE